MKQGNLERWSNWKTCKNLLFFSELVNELLFDYSIPSNRVSTLNSHFLCQDALNAINGIDNDGVPEGTLKPIVEELYTALAVDPVFSDDDPSPLDYFLKFDNNKYRNSSRISELNYLEMKNAVNSIDTLFFNDYNYYERLKKRITEIVIEEDVSRQIDLFRLVKSLLTEIINIGYTQQYIYYVMEHNFWTPNKNIISPDQISLFFEAFTFKTKEFKVVFSVEDRKIFQLKKFLQGITVEKNMQPVSNNHKEKQFLNIKSNESFISFYVSSYDFYGAAQQARKTISSIISFYRLYDHYYKYNFNTIGCGVYERNLFFRIGSPKSATKHTRKPSDVRIRKSFDSFAEMTEKALQDEDYLQWLTLSKAIQFHTHSLDSISKENQLLDLWALFESSLNIKNKHHSDRIQQVCIYLVPILKRKYIYSLFEQLAHDIKTYSEEKYKTIIGGAKVEKEIVQKICEFTLLPESEKEREDFISSCDDFPLLQERIKYYSDKLKTPSDIYVFVEKHATRVRWQIMRIYRNRNLIAHNGSSMPYLDLLIENLHSYADDFIEYIINCCYNNHTMESMWQELYTKECNWNKQFSRNKNELDSDIIKKLLSY